MQDMQMGVNQFELLLQQDTNGNKIWKTEVVLSICVTGRSDFSKTYYQNKIISNFVTKFKL